jgi:hypothetical protein
MRSHPNQPALLANLGGMNLPPVALNVPAQYQFCVDAGASAAVGFFDDLAAVGLHDHIACSMHAFTSAVRAGMAVTGDYSPPTMQACTDAFAAGYLGRIQQELRLFHGESVGRNQAGTDARMFTHSHTNH